MKLVFNACGRKKNKKAEAYNILNYSLLRFPFIIIAATIIVLFYNATFSINMDPVNITNMAHVNRIIYSPSSIAYTDASIGRTYPGIVDLSRFNEETLKKTFDYEDINLVFRLELKNLETGNTDTIYLNEEWYGRWEPLAAAGFDDYIKMSQTRFVLIKGGPNLQKGLLTITEVNNLE